MCVGMMEWGIGLHNHEILASWFDRTGPACVGIFSFAFFSVACSMFNMVLIALDRLLYITKPFFYSRVVTSKKVKRTIVLVWITAFLWGAIPLAINTYDETDSHCTMQAAIPGVYRVYSNVPVLFSGALTTGIVYIIIARTAIKHRNAIYKSTPGALPSGKTDWNTGVTATDLTEAAKAAINTMKSNMRTLKLFIIVFGLLLFCWLPYYIIEFTSDFIHISDKVYRASTALGFLNSGVNFLVYPMYSKSFRRAFRSLLCPCLKNTLTRSYSGSTFVSQVKPSSKGGGGPPKPVLGQFNPPPTNVTTPAANKETNVAPETGHSNATAASSNKGGGDSTQADTLANETAYPLVSDSLSVPPQFQGSISSHKSSSPGRTLTDVPVVDVSAVSNSVGDVPAKTDGQTLGDSLNAHGSQDKTPSPSAAASPGWASPRADSLSTSQNDGMHLFNLFTSAVSPRPADKTIPEVGSKVDVNVSGSSSSFDSSSD